MRLSIPAILLLLIAALAGCTGSGGPAAACSGSTCAPAPTAGTGEFSDDTGAITGLVVDDSFNPIANAIIGLQENAANTSSDAGGRFAFDHVAPGTYSLFANALGYKAAGKQISVEAGKRLDLRVVLEALPTVQPYTDTKQFAGLIECGFGTAALVGNCIPLQFLFDMIGTNPTSTRTVGKYVITDYEKVQGGVFEMAWTPSAGGTGQSLGLYVDDDGTGPTSPASQTHGTANGGSPVRVQVDSAAYKLLKPDKNKIQTRTFLTGSTPPNFVVNQRFTVYGTACYLVMCDDTFTALKDA